MTPEEALGGVLSEAADLEAAARAIAKALLSSPHEAVKILSAAGIDSRLVASITTTVDRDPGRVGLLVAGAIAWARGRQAVPPAPTWEPVATVPAPLRPPPRLRRETAETLVSLVAGARQRVRLAAPFSDVWTGELLAVPLAAATARDVLVEVILPPAVRPGPQRDMAEVLTSAVALEGKPTQFHLIRSDTRGPWPHLKVVTVDGRSAYVGSANLTAAGLGANVEVGALVGGRDVEVLDALLDLLIGSLGRGDND